ncbi:hypothetical protein ACFWPX_30060 [Nocardia sp. NPDC058518]|uniref:hypothetical protein n=1 Tax=Nocardia sp. NPDC058518 TaxID=3346534 RepID=UPI0036673C59
MTTPPLDAGPAAEVRRAVATWNTPAMLAPILRVWRLLRANHTPAAAEQRPRPKLALKT